LLLPLELHILSKDESLNESAYYKPY